MPQLLAVIFNIVDIEPIAIYVNHIKMVKFASKKNYEYETISKYLQIIIHNIKDVIISRWEIKGRVDANI